MQHSVLNKLAITTALMAIALCAAADVPRTVSYQGYLADDEGIPFVDGTYGVTFAIYDVPTGGVPMWTSGSQPVEVSGGVFHYNLGSNIPFSDDLFAGSSRWLGLSVGGAPEIEPRVLICAVPYSLEALHADTADYSFAAPSTSIEFDFDQTYSMSQGQTRTIYHNQYGDVNRYIVIVDGKSNSSSGWHQANFGTCPTGGLYPDWLGLEWYGLTNSQIKVERASDDNQNNAKDWDSVRVRIISNQ